VNKPWGKSSRGRNGKGAKKGREQPTMCIDKLSLFFGLPLAHMTFHTFLHALPRAKFLHQMGTRGHVLKTWCYFLTADLHHIFYSYLNLLQLKHERKHYPKV